MSIIFKIPTYSLLQYAGSPTNEDQRYTKKLLSHLKLGRAQQLSQILNCLSPENKIELNSFFGENALLVPIPRSAPLISRDATWPALEICKELVKFDYANTLEPLLHRKNKINKAAFQNGAHNRPTVKQHIDSLALIVNSIQYAAITTIVLVDDVVTQGRTATACASIIKSACPWVENVKLFAVARSGKFETFERSFFPKAAHINYYRSGKTIHTI